MKTLDRVKQIIPADGRFTATDIAEWLNLPIEYGFQNTSKKATRYLLQLCKDGILYQWFISNGSKHDTTDCCPMFTCYYLRRDSEMAKWILLRNRSIRGHRII